MISSRIPLLLVWQAIGRDKVYCLKGKNDVISPMQNGRQTIASMRTLYKSIFPDIIGTGLIEILLLKSTVL